jgi:hypothetical protein
VITGIAIIIRSIPGWIYAAWGCDFGIYSGITNSVITSNELFPAYSGWGGSYNEFPVLYAINAFAHWVTGIDVVTLMPKLVPIFGGLTVLIYYFLIWELTKNKKIAIVSSLLLAVLPFHVNQLTHASPLTIGHFFLVLSMYLFIKFRRNSNYIIPLFISTCLLIMSHHFSTYIYIISLFFIIFLENFYQEKWTNTIKKDIFYILLTSGLTFAYWATIATTVYDNFMSGGFTLGPIVFNSNTIITLFYVLFFASMGFIWLKRKKSLFTGGEKNKQTARQSFNLFLIAFVVCLSLMIIFSIIKLPSLNFSFNPVSVIWAIPLLIVFSLVVAGFRHTRFIKNGFLIRGWLFGLILSFIYGFIANFIGNSSLYPHRHIEYMMYTLAIIAVYGIGSIFSDPDYKVLLSQLSNKKDLFVSYISKKVKISQKKRLIHISLTSLLVISLAISVYPLPTTLGQSSEIITTEDLNTIEWINEKIDKNLSLIASDHRLERMIESRGFNTTKDESLKIWTTENISEYIDELIGIGKNYSKITHVLVDDIMKNDVVHIGIGKEGVHMINETWTGGYDKFLKQPFNLIYRNESINLDSVTFEPVHWAEVYEINWTYIDNYYFKS